MHSIFLILVEKIGILYALGVGTLESTLFPQRSTCQILRGDVNS